MIIFQPIIFESVDESNSESEEIEESVDSVSTKNDYEKDQSTEENKIEEPQEEADEEEVEEEEEEEIKLTLDQIKSMKVVELKQELKNRGISTTGLKAELVKKLYNAINN